MNRLRHCIVAALLAIVATAQTEEVAQQRAPKLALSGSTTAVGGGIETCLFTKDGRHMVTVGSCGDVLCWDTAKLRVVARHRLPRGTVLSVEKQKGQQVLYVQCYAVAPSWKLSACHRFEYGDGTLTHGTVAALPKVDMLSLPNENREAECASGSVRLASRLGKIKRTFLGKSTEWDQKTLTNLWIQSIWISPIGMVVACDVNGQLFVLGTNGAKPQVFGGHRAPVAGLAWSPDGRYLAVQSMSGVRIVDRVGNLVHERFGTYVVAPGENGPEFLLMSMRQIESFNAAVQRTVGSPVRFRGGRADLTTGTIDGHVMGEELPLFSAAPFVPVADGWVCSGAWIGGRHVDCAHIGTDGTVTARKLGKIQGEYPGISCGQLVAFGEEHALLASYFTTPQSCGNALMGSSVFGSLRALRSDGEQFHHVAMGVNVRSMRVLPGREQVLVHTGDGTITAFDSGLEVRHSFKAESLRWFEILDARHALAGGRSRSWLVDIATGKRTRIDLPEGIESPRLSAMGAGGHLALARGADVWIVTTQ